MARKRLSDLLQEEVKKPEGGESTIDVPASEVKEEKKTASSNVDLEATVKELKQTLEKAQKNEEALSKQAQEFQFTIAEQEELSKQLQNELDEAKKLGDLQDILKEVKEELATARQNEKALQVQVEELHITLAEKEASLERLTTELYAAKKDALQLAEANTKLTAEMNAAQKVAARQPAYRQVPARQPAAKKPVPNQSAIAQPKKDYSSSLAYRKSYSRPTGPLPGKQPPESDNSSMWLLD
ncbi:MAG: hypothetical protein ACFB2X_27825 [Rivularia sp. (in: cyanobacteria)]